MRVVIDVLGAPALSGGMRLHAREVIAAWARVFPDDVLTVLAPTWVGTEFARHSKLAIVEVSKSGFSQRAFGQFVTAGRVARREHADALLSLSPIVSPFFPRNKRFATVHDLRHTRNPLEFSRGQRLYRRLWRISVARAAGVAAISVKTLNELRVYAPSARLWLAQNGGDHPKRWRTTEIISSGRVTVVTYGHHPNKRPELLIEALSVMAPSDRLQIDLVVLGARGAQRDALMERAAQLGVESHCSFPGFIDDEDYKAIIAGASAIVLASSDEGFGLPVAEARFFGIPILWAADSGLDEIHGNNPLEFDPTSSQDLASKIGLALSDNSPRYPGTVLTWDDTVRSLRAMIRGER